jgi:beta-lactam-binding protein with PASTA domain
MRRTLVVLALVLTLAGCGARSAPPPVAAQPPAAAEASPTLITMPNLVGQNADVAVDKLKKLGLTNVDLGTVDGHRVIILPQNWTVRTQSAKPGEQLAPDAKIVLGCARNG